MRLDSYAQILWRDMVFAIALPAKGHMAGARHSLRVSGAADNLILGRQEPNKVSGKCEMSGFAKREMRNVRFTMADLNRSCSW